MFVSFQKYQFVYRNKVNSPPIRQFPSRDHNLNVKAQGNLKIYFWGKVHFVLGFLAKDIAIYLCSQNTSLTQALKPLEISLCSFRLFPPQYSCLVIQSSGIFGQNQHFRSERCVLFKKIVVKEFTLDYLRAYLGTLRYQN